MRSRFVFLLLISARCLCAQSIVPVKVEITISSLQKVHDVPCDLDKLILDSTNFLSESKDPEFLKSLDAFIEEYGKNGKRPEKKVLAAEWDYRAAAVIMYSDGSGRDIAAGTGPYVKITGVSFEDKNHDFYRLLNKFIELETVKKFLKDIDEGKDVELNNLIVTQPNYPEKFHSQRVAIKNIEIFVIGLQIDIERDVSVENLISDKRFFVLKSEDRFLMNAVSSFCSETELKNEIKSKNKLTKEFRVALSIVYEDGSNGFVAAGMEPCVNINGRFYKNEDYRFLKFVNTWVPMKTIQLFLDDLPKGKREP